MGLLTDLVKTTIKVVAAPIYVPLKILEILQEPSQYNYPYHDSGIERDADSLSDLEQNSNT